MNRFLPALALMLCATAATRAETMTLDEAIRYALLHQPDAAIAAAQTQSAAGQVRVATAGYLPSLSVEASASRIQNQPHGYQGASTIISATQLLFDAGRTPKAIAAAHASLRAARAADLDTRLLVARNVTDAYFALLQAQGITRANEEAVASRQSQRDAAAAKLQAGTAARFDLLRADTALAQSKQALASAQGDVRRALSRLNAAIGRPAEAAIDVVEPPAPPDITFEDAVKQALAQRPDIESARQSLKAARSTLSATKLGNAPAVSASGSYTGSDRSFPASDLEWRAGVSVSWAAFDGLLTQGQVQSARGAVLRAEAALKQAELTASREVADAVTAVQVAADQVRLGETTVAQATEARDVAVGRYSAGAGTQLEVTDAESQLRLAQVNLINARYTLANSRRTLFYVMGRMP